MVNGPYYTDREFPPEPRIKEDVSQTVWGGIIAAIQTRIADGSFAYLFPMTCSRKGLPYGCDEHSFSLALKARIRNVGWPLNPDQVPPISDIRDLIEFCYEAVADAQEYIPRPTLADLAKIFPDEKPCHKHLEFDVGEGQEAFRDDINYIFARNGIAYELDDEGQVIRLGPEPLRETLTPAAFNTGDPELDNLLESARNKYLDPDLGVRKDSLEKLWDAWERLKTIEPGKDKKESTKNILDKAASELNFREVLEREATELNRIGNSFRIRHSEKSQIALAENEHIDYLFYRMFALIWLLLRATNRGS